MKNLSETCKDCKCNNCLYSHQLIENEGGNICFDWCEKQCKGKILNNIGTELCFKENK